jgi:protein-tyrosine phosphatase
VWVQILSACMGRPVRNRFTVTLTALLVLKINSLMNPYWIEAGPLRLAILPRPRGWDWLPDDIAAARRDGVDVIVSTLTKAENQELGLSEEAKCCKESMIEFLSFPIEDRSLPDSEGGVNSFIDSLGKRVKQGKSVAIHCRAGIGRSSLLCACLLVRRGLSAESAFEKIQLARGCAVPDTEEQRSWVQSFASRSKS